MQCTEAVAFEAAAALDAYEDQLFAMRRLGANQLRIATIQKEMKRVCSCCHRLPQLSGASIALLLAHHRLLAKLASTGEDNAGLPAAGSQEVEQCVLTLQRACRELFLAPRLH
jgi:hypothetical protein